MMAAMSMQPLRMLMAVAAPHEVANDDIARTQSGVMRSAMLVLLMLSTRTFL